MTTCPSGVQYRHLVDHAREYIEQTYRRPLSDRVLRWLLENRARITLVVIVGLMLGSLRALWPWQGDNRELLAPSTQVGLAVALFYTLLGIPIAMIADRSNRTRIITIALVVWSAMTAVCGLAQNFWQLFLARLGVGVGEAGGVAPAYSLVADYFPSHQRARALGAYSFGVPIGSALGIVLGGVIASLIDWRTAFVAVGIAGILLAPVFHLVVKEPPRGRFDAPAANTRPARFGEVMRLLLGKRSFWGLSFGASASSMMGYGMFFWLPSFFVRSHGLTLLEASLYFGTILLIGGMAGIWLGGMSSYAIGYLGNWVWIEKYLRAQIE
jgi:MFS family permease